MKKAEILVVEDNAADRFWLECVLKNIGVDCSISSVEDGEQAVDFLLKRGEYFQAPTPDIIFLDAHLPRLDAIEVLRQVPGASDLPICVLTCSGVDQPIFQREFGIPESDYLLKPVSQTSVLGSSCGHELFRPTDFGVRS